MNCAHSILLTMWGVAAACQFPATGRAADAPLSMVECARPSPTDPGTRFNVGWASKLIDGVSLQPGEVFSFNRAMDRGRDDFKLGRSYFAGRVVMSKGGGYCQVSTALYDAALLAGLRIIERRHHSFYDKKNAYVPAGLDASVSNYAGTDFRFENTTGQPLTISARAKSGAVKIELRGHATAIKRWLTTKILAETPRPTRTVVDGAMPPCTMRTVRPGFDGYSVVRYLNSVDASGNTKVVSLGKDRYQAIEEVVEAGPCVARAHEERSSLSNGNGAQQ